MNNEQRKGFDYSNTEMAVMGTIDAIIVLLLMAFLLMGLDYLIPVELLDWIIAVLG